MSDKSHDPNQMTGAAMVVRALIDHGVKHIFGYPGALLMPHQDVLDFTLLEDLVIDRKHRAAGIAEDMLDAMIDQRAHDHCCAGHLIGIVALVTHGLLGMRCCRAAFFSWISRNKKRAQEAPAHRLNLGWP